MFEMNRTAASASGGHGETLVLEPDRARIEELDDLGYHFGVETEGSEAFSNLNSEDMIFLSEVSDAVSEGVFWSEKGLLIRNDIVVMEHPCHITSGSGQIHASSENGLRIEMTLPSIN